MADFDTAFRLLMKAEGGYAPQDATAGSVNFGLTERFLATIGYRKRPKDLTEDDARNIYRKYFWDAYGLGRYASQRLANFMLLFIVNMSPGRVTSAANRVMSKLGIKGPLRKVTDEQAGPLIDGMKEELRRFYDSLIARRPDLYARYRQGWYARLEMV